MTYHRRNRSKPLIPDRRRTLVDAQKDQTPRKALFDQLSLLYASANGGDNSTAAADADNENAHTLKLTETTLRDIDDTLAEMMSLSLDEHTKYMAAYFQEKYKPQLIRAHNEIKTARSSVEQIQRTTNAKVKQLQWQIKDAAAVKAKYEKALETIRDYEEQDRKRAKTLKGNTNTHTSEETRLIVQHQADQIGELRNANEEMKRSLGLSALEVQKYNEQVNALKNEVSTMNAERLQLAHKLEALQIGLTERTNELSEVRGRVSHVNSLEQELAWLKRDKESLKNAQKSLRSQLLESYREQEIGANKYRALRRRLLTRSVWFQSQLIELKRMIGHAVEFSRTFQSQLTCHWCLGIFCDPQMLPCGHSGCARCIERATDGIGTVVCADCRKTYQPHEGVANVVVDDVSIRYHGWMIEIDNVLTKLERTR